MCKERKKKREQLQKEEKSKQKQMINCASKVVYPTKHAAEEAAKLLRKKYGNIQNVYHCSICGKYHITSQVKGKDKK